MGGGAAAAGRDDEPDDEDEEEEDDDDGEDDALRQPVAARGPCASACGVRGGLERRAGVALEMQAGGSS